MANRFQELFRIKPNLYHEGSPVIIEAAAIQKDTVTDTVLAQVKIRNLRDEKIIACKISIRAYEPNGMEVEGIHSYPYLDINAGPGEAFGSKIPVYLPDMKTRRISISVIEAVYADDYVWKEDPTEWEPVPIQELIADAISDPELRRQYYLEVDGACSYVPAIDKGLFLCTCGTINLAEAEKCYKCKKTYSFLSRIYDMDYLKEKAEERLELEREKQERAAAQEQERLAREKEAKERAERAAAEEREKREKQKRKRRKALMIGIPAAVLCIALAVFTPTVIMPTISNVTAYRNAARMLEAGDFDNAKNAFEALSGYKDADTMALEAIYRKADACCADKDYHTAIQLWKGLNGYADSAERVQNAETSWKEEKNAAAYSAAKELMEKKDYVAAAGAFDALGGFLDSADLSAQCEELRKESIYQSAVTNIEEERYDEAITILQKIQGYKDSDMLRQSTAYDYGCALMDEKKCSLASSYFGIASGYKDADTRKLESLYQAAVADIEEERYDEAITTLQKIQGYKDSDMLCQSAAYDYGNALMDEKEYSLASSYFSMASGYKDADTRKLEACYENACQFMDNGKYTSAIMLFNRDCVGYKDSDSKLLQAKYGYVSTHMLSFNRTTYDYLKELTKAGYPGSKALYNELYGWSVEITCISNNEKDYRGIMKKISRYDTAWFSYKITGGAPDESADVLIKWKLPGCDPSYETHTYQAGENYDGMGIYFTNGAKAGTASVSFYKDGELIGYGSVEME